jgi:hypothetical protein
MAYDGKTGVDVESECVVPTVRGQSGKSVFDKLISEARRAFISDLNLIGIPEKSFTIRVKELKNKGHDPSWLALYRSRSQFGQRPIFWVNARLIEMMDREGIDIGDRLRVVIDTLSHEYGHVIEEWVHVRGTDEAKRMLKNGWGNDMEEFAEDFMQYARGGGVLGRNRFEPLIALYLEDVFEKYE